MPFGSVRLVSGINVERTPTLLEAGYSQSQLIRFKDGLAQKYGGWQKFYPTAVGGVPRDLHAWEDLNNSTHLAVGTTTQLSIITSGAQQDITPQIFLSDFAPDFTTTIGSATVQIADPNIANVTVFDTIFFNTPVAVGGLILSGLYQITQITGVSSYDITASSNATASVANGGAVPLFTTTSGTSSVTVTIPAHGLAAGGSIYLSIDTTGNGVTIGGHYTVVTVGGANTFTINAANEATASSSFSMNSGNAELLYYINIGPPAAGAGYGLGGYGTGGYGTGTAAASAQSGTPITSTDWTSDNWGEILIACPSGGGIYQFDPTGGFTNAGLVATAPPFNGGAFVSTSQQILVCWASTVTRDIGVQQDPMLGEMVERQRLHGLHSAHHQPGRLVPHPDRLDDQGRHGGRKPELIWTDIDLWAMNYQGPPVRLRLQQDRSGSRADLLACHAAVARRRLLDGAEQLLRLCRAGRRR
jgi:hypothetical protein